MAEKKSQAKVSHQRLQYLKHWYDAGGVLLMSYEMYRSLLVKEQPEQHTFQFYLQDPGPSIVVMDEGHRLKNSMSRLSILVQRIKTPARICLTASPLQNNLDEFYCLVNLVTPGLLPDHDHFNLFYKRPIENVFSDSPKSDLYIAKKQLLKLQLLTSDVVLRRGAELLDVDLPRKTEFYVSCRMTNIQYAGYKQLLDHFRRSNESVMIGFIALRALCNHPAILRKLLIDRDLRHAMDEDPDVSTEADEFGQITTDTRDKLLRVLDNYYQAIEDVEDPRISSKVVVIMRLVDAIKENGEKTIVVSHSITCLNFLEKLLGARGSGICRIDGNTPQPDRQKIIDVFNNALDKHVMLLSAMAGSLGVNVTGASRIILSDSAWNPVHDEQSIGRIYRYGQTRPVFVYRLTEYSTIEDAIMIRKIHKRGISSRVMDNKYLRRQDKGELRRYYSDPEWPEERVDLESCNDDPLLKRVAEAERQAFARIRQQRDVENKIEAGIDAEEGVLSDEDVLRIRREAFSEKKAFIIQTLHDPKRSNVSEKDILLAACSVGPNATDKTSPVFVGASQTG
ncbi:P-loop containing nucleoside triphosphate hydrolase protein [Dichotomocladium elegans]|nr:P-loop containing nucleoside triphosphate hydrolase protein [Dichotomocladium elegans]